MEKDSSFLVLHCGTFERVAFRHRSSQTLFVSDLIDVARCKNPGYGHIHIGLFISIIEDIRDRTHQILLQEAVEKSTTRKCKYAPSENIISPRTRKRVALEESRKSEYIKNFKVRAQLKSCHVSLIIWRQTVCENLADRKLALLRIQCGSYNSTSPSSLIRVDETKPEPKSKYKPHEYFRITITSELAYGTTGDAHIARIDLLGSDGKPLSFSNVVIKLSFGELQKKRLWHEFCVYDHLMSAGARGVPYIFGLFEDIETEALALVMENVGLSLWDCRLPDKSKRLQNTLSESEK